MRVLVVDDEENVLSGLTTFLSLRGIDNKGVALFAEALTELERGEYQAAFFDLRLGRHDGIELLTKALGLRPELQVVMISGNAEIEDALKAIRAGAVDFLEKPLDQTRLAALCESLAARAAQTISARGFEEDWLNEHFAGRSSMVMRELLALSRRTASSGLNVLLEGPSGSGKEVIARFIRLCSPRSRQPLITVNCAALPSELIESELFGYRKGAFSGAQSDRQGFFQAADGGTLFLDEIGEIPTQLQGKLLRALEYGEVQRVGSSDVERVNVRLVSATNRDLDKELAAGRFREDLFYRLAQVRLRLPALQERQEDIGSLADFFLGRCQAGDARLAQAQPGQASAAKRSFSEDAKRLLSSRSYRGNVRELKNIVERAYYLCPEGIIRYNELSQVIDQGEVAQKAEMAKSPVLSANEAPQAQAGLELGPFTLGHLRDARAEFERRYVQAVLSRHEGQVARSAECLGLLPNNLSRLIRDLGLRKP